METPRYVNEPVNFTFSGSFFFLSFDRGRSLAKPFTQKAHHQNTSLADISALDNRCVLLENLVEAPGI